MKKDNRPRIELPPSQVIRILNVAGGALVLATILIPFFSLGSVPAVVPSHLAADGTPDAWRGPYYIFFAPAISLASFVMLTVVNRFPHLFNYPVPITEENAPRQYALARAFVTVLKTIVAVLFLWVEYLAVNITMLGKEGRWRLIFPVMLVAVFGTVMAYMMSAFRKR
jgi:hypothetical protein